ncbi:hypothetical protein COI42_28250, partial [Priestia aryabhattai]
SQGSAGRHKCAGCAFEPGRMLRASGKTLPYDNSVLENLHESQAGTVRHKDAFAAFALGFTQGRK